MKLSTKSRYGLRILIQIATDNLYGKKLSQGKKIAERQGISEPYLEQIMIPFKKSGFVSTVRGCNGGYELKKSSDEITVLDIIELFEGRIYLSECMGKSEGCNRESFCPTADIWKELEEVFREKARSITLGSILEKYEKNLTPDYII